MIEFFCLNLKKLNHKSLQKIISIKILKKPNVIEHHKCFKFQFKFYIIIK